MSLASIFSRRWARGVDVRGPDKTLMEDALPSAGTAYVFRTAPFCDASPVDTGRYAVFKVLAAHGHVVAIGVLDGIWPAVPTLQMIDGARIVRETRFAFTGRLAAFGVPVERWYPSDLDGLRPLGTVRVRRDERELGARIASFGSGGRYARLAAASEAAEGEWRWKHDREALVNEWGDSERKREVARAAAADVSSRSRDDLTWEELLAETPFAAWNDRSHHLPRDFTVGARSAIQESRRRLSELGGRPAKTRVRKILRECVVWFNEADRLAGGVIETEERADIHRALEEMAIVAGQDVLITEIGSWRDW